jgi:hypothetical protein
MGWLGQWKTGGAIRTSVAIGGSNASFVAVPADANLGHPPLPFRSREKNVLDVPSYGSGHGTSLRRLFASLLDNERYGDVSPTIPAVLSEPIASH